MNTQTSILIAAICVIVISCEGSGYEPQPAQSTQSVEAQHFPHPIYGAPPPPISRSKLEYDAANYNPGYPPVPVLKAVVRTLEPIGKNYEVNLSQSLPEQTPQHQQFGFGGPTYLPPRLPPQAVQQKPFHLRLSSAPRSIPYTPQQNPLLIAPQSAPPTPFNPPQSQPLPSNEYQPYLPSIVAEHFAKQNNQVGANDNSYNYQTGQSDSSANGAVGNYISQSGTSELDHYFEKQNPVGEVRAYARLISTCYPDGRCDQQKLGSGLVDAKHQNIVWSARARVQPISNKCRSSHNQNQIVDHNFASGQGDKSATLDSAAIKAHTSLNVSPIRPPNRRLYPYTETVIARDPFN